MKVNFIIMGATKGGTSTLFYHLKNHPEVVTSSVKETNFFSEYVYSYKGYNECFEGKGKVAGEASPNYLAIKEVPERIHRYNPEMKLIYILRDPCDRAYSHYKMHLDKEHFNPFYKLLPFLKEIKKNPDYIERGLYTKHIRNVLEYFTKEQMLFLKYEDLLNNGQQVMNEIFDFLGVKQIDIDEKIIMGPAGKIENRKPYKLKRRKTILKYFINDIEKLERITNWDLTSWKI